MQNNTITQRYNIIRLRDHLIIDNSNTNILNKTVLPRVNAGTCDTLQAIFLTSRHGKTSTLNGSNGRMLKILPILII